MNHSEGIKSLRSLTKLARAWRLGTLLLGAILLAQAIPARAADSAATDQSQVRLISAVTATGDLQKIPFGIAITLKDGWKTYWRSPGDAGFAPTIDIAGSVNVAAAELSYPVPHRFELFGLQTFGYGGEIVYPLSVTPQQPGAAVTLKARLRYLVCEQVCIP